MYNRLKRLFETGLLTLIGLKNALNYKWITNEQFEEIKNSNPNE